MPCCAVVGIVVLEKNISSQIIPGDDVVGPGIESCSAGKNGKEAIVVNNSD